MGKIAKNTELKLYKYQYWAVNVIYSKIKIKIAKNTELKLYKYQYWAVNVIYPKINTATIIKTYGLFLLLKVRGIFQKWPNTHGQRSRLG